MTPAGLVTVADLLSRNAPVPVRIPIEEPEPVVSVGSLLRREGRAPRAADRPVQQRGDRQDGEPPASGGARVVVRRSAVAAGGLLAVGAVFGAAVTHDAGSLRTDDLAGPYPGQGRLDNTSQGPLGGLPGTVVDQTAVASTLDAGTAPPRSWIPVAFPSATGGAPDGAAGGASGGNGNVPPGGQNAGTQHPGAGGAGGQNAGIPGSGSSNNGPAAPGSGTAGPGGPSGSTDPGAGNPGGGTPGSGEQNPGGQLGEAAGNVGDGLGRTVDNVGDGLGRTVDNVGDGLGGAVEGVGDAAGGPLGQTVSGVGGALRTVTGGLGDALSGGDSSSKGKERSTASDEPAMSGLDDSQSNDSGGSGGLLGGIGRAAAGLLGG